MQVLNVRRATVYARFTRWETGWLAELANAAGRRSGAHGGRRAAVSTVRENRQQLKDVTATLRQELHKDFSPRTLKRF